jgi:lysophospholipase L1-like esterase
LIAAWSLGCSGDDGTGQSGGAAGRGGGQTLDASSGIGGSGGAGDGAGSAGSSGVGEAPDVGARFDASDAAPNEMSNDAARPETNGPPRADANEAAVVGDATDAPWRDSGATDSAAPYNPCPAAPAPCVILPLGDSITDGVGSTGGGYRVELFRLAHSQGHNITFVGGSTPNGPAVVDGVPFPRNHEGHSGFTIDNGGGRAGIQPLVVGSLTNFRPHIVLLMIGTNDIDLQLDVANAPTRLGQLIDTIVDTAPSALVVVAQIVPSQDNVLNARIQTYNAAIPALVDSRVSAGRHLLLVDMYRAITANPNYQTVYFFDRLHPNNAGYIVMANLWYGAIGALLR